MIVCIAFVIIVKTSNKIPYKSKVECRTEIATIFMEGMSADLYRHKK